MIDWLNAYYVRGMLRLLIIFEGHQNRNQYKYDAF